MSWALGKNFMNVAWNSSVPEENRITVESNEARTYHLKLAVYRDSSFLLLWASDNLFPSKRFQVADSLEASKIVLLCLSLG